MPTAAKLVAALWFAAMGWLGANAHIPALGETPHVGLFREISAVIGMICGWRILGLSARGSYADAIGTGLKTSVIMAFFVLLVFSGYQMVHISMKGRYDGPLDAMLGVFELGMENAVKMATVGVLGVLILGGVLGGLLTEAARRRWR